MLSSGDFVDLDLGTAAGRDAAFRHPAIVVTAQRILDASPSVVQVVPVTSTIRPFGSEIAVAPDIANGLERSSAAQCQHVRAVSPARVLDVRGNVGRVVLAQIRVTIAVIIDVLSPDATIVAVADNCRHHLRRRPCRCRRLRQQAPCPG